MQKIIKLHTSLFITGLSLLAGCNKTEFLAKKPSTNIVTPSTLSDFQQLLDNPDFTYTDGLPQESCDEYQVSYADFQATSITERNAYTWAKDLFEGNGNVSDWNGPYSNLFYVSNVLTSLAASDSANSPQGQFIKGQALFKRAYAFYNLTRCFCQAYDAASAATDLGVPLRLTPSVNGVVPRSTLQQTFDLILSDLHTCIPLLPAQHPATDPTRPSRTAAYALLARIYLDKRDYTNAEAYADSSLGIYNTLIDYNTVSTTSTTPFSRTNAELIYNTTSLGTVNSFGLTFTATFTSAAARITPEIMALYDANDLRTVLYFVKNTDGLFQRKRGYSGSGYYPFSGLATDELYLIKAECLARRGATAPAMAELNALLINRYTNTVAYVPLTAASSDDALAKVLLERRKELIWRNIRWQDLKRLNKEGANITLTRTVNGTVYTLPPNDPRYVFPIPQDEIDLSGIQQNPR